MIPGGADLSCYPTYSLWLFLIFSGSAQHAIDLCQRMDILGKLLRSSISSSGGKIGRRIMR